jgi:hypothetical protein
LRVQSIGLPELIPQVHSDDQRVLFVPFGEVLCTLKEHVLRILPAPPESVSIIIGATPLGLGGVVVEDHHQSAVGQDFDGVVEHFHGPFALEFRVGGYELVRYDVIFIEHLEGVGESDAVHLELVLNVESDILQRTTFKSVDTVPGHVCPRPVGPSEFYSFARFVDDGCVAGAEGEHDFQGFRDCFFCLEMLLMVKELFHELFFGGEVLLVAHDSQDSMKVYDGLY